MNRTEKARKILKRLDETINVNWAFENHYLNAIEVGLIDIEVAERSGDAEMEGSSADDYCEPPDKG